MGICFNKKKVEEKPLAEPLVESRITEIDKLKIEIKGKMNKIDNQMKQYERNMNEESNKIKEYMKMNNKVMAKECLKSYKRSEGMLKFMKDAKSKLQIQIDTVSTAEQNKEILDSLKNTNAVLDDLTKVDYTSTVKEFLKKNEELANQMEVLNEVEVSLNMSDNDTDEMFKKFMEDNNTEGNGDVNMDALNNILPKMAEQQPPQAVEEKKQEENEVKKEEEKEKEKELEIEY